jgi:hypothetical protein
MKNPQIININPVDQGGDAVLSFIGSDVIYDSTQLPIDDLATIQVGISLWNLTDDSARSQSPLVMTYHEDANFWTIPISDIASILTNRNKYVGSIAAVDASGMRSFQVLEFTVDNDGLEDVWMHLPYEIKVDGGEAWFIWYQADHIGEVGFEVWMAEAYQGGTGTTFASSPEKVTHRGAIVPYHA